MRPKSFAILLLALGCGLVASLGIMHMVRRGSAPEPLNGGGVYVASTDVGMGEQLSEQVLRLESWPTGKIPTGAISRLEDVDGRRTRARLYPGEPILEDKLFAKGVNSHGAAAMITKGFRVVPVKVDAVTGGSSLILPGDTVDVMIHLVRDPGREIPETVTRTILQDVKVFAVNDVLNTEREKEGSKSIVAKTISLLVTPDQAAKVMLATQLGNVSLVLRSPEDDKMAVAAQAKPSDLLGAVAKNDREKDSPGETTKPEIKPEKKPKTTVVAKPHETWTIVSIRAGSVDDVVLEATDAGKPGAALGKKWKIVSGTASQTTSQTPSQDVGNGIGGLPPGQRGKTPDSAAKTGETKSEAETPKENEKKPAVREVAKELNL
jgi:pilus assembly protein CpaB